MTANDTLITIIDDDASFRRSVARVVHAAGYLVQTFADAADFLKHPNMTNCLVLDVFMPGLSGLGLQQELAKTGSDIPIIFLTAHGDIPTSVRAMKAGAIEFLTKPVDREALIAAIHTAFARDRENRAHQA